ncbi:hypothetical protein P4S72_07750 [Vibrio sp. PP-XX7]
MHKFSSGDSGIELGEIEQVLMKYSGICNAAVMLVTDEVAQGVSDDRAAIMAWIVPDVVSDAGHQDDSGDERFNHDPFRHDPFRHKQLRLRRISLVAG